MAVVSPDGDARSLIGNKAALACANKDLQTKHVCYTTLFQNLFPIIIFPILTKIGPFLASFQDEKPMLYEDEPASTSSMMKVKESTKCLSLWHIHKHSIPPASKQ